MTQSGEELTLKGEIRSVEITYSRTGVDQAEPEMPLPPSEKPGGWIYQMIFVLKGEALFFKRGATSESARIGSQLHNLCCIKPGSLTMALSSPGDEIICINLSAAFLDRYLYNDPAWQKIRTASKRPALVTLAKSNMHITPEISAVLHRLDQSSGDPVCDRLLLESKVMELLALQISQRGQLQNASRSLNLKKEEMDKMVAARDILINADGEQLSLRSLAHLVGTNEFNLKRDFKIAFGSTVYNYLTRHKMEQAKRMLEEEDISVAEVASKLNYKYATHFSVAFKKYFGYLPSRLKSAKP
ncbi:AraC-like DNA-binding protein [Arcticibacter pallidicorallinus]|uniref:AraC-like DNA-binding protein n=1 Tax=Arcticibacter pallidicorallinus TaxID=1259464 RepID=A0A2T0UBJ9_9SPHI|nr:AraC family transcriptional regulator [Arcticibacter pallidicorallinus]PRY55248.1 AraC-like DNA-binding protein [Arcticibacter pallidicorallinus]